MRGSNNVINYQYAKQAQSVNNQQIMTSQKQIRAAFWEAHERHEIKARKNGTFSKGQNSQVCDTRLAFIDYVNSLARDGIITSKLANRATL